jgi:integrase
LISLRVKQVDLEHRILRLEPGTTKHKEGREAPMTDTMLQLLTACVEGKGPDAYVFTRPNGKSVRDFRVTWQNACDHAGVSGLLFHDLRRTAASNLRRAGLSESMIKQIGGWKTTSVFHRYAIVNRQDMATAMRQFEEHQRQLAAARAENNHSSSIVGEFEAEKPASDKLQ